MESEESQISVWVCREEKLVLGLSRRTSCADVVKVLLEERQSRRGLSGAQPFCIVEKWRGFERVLPNRTKMLRLWVAWGDEQRNVKFVLVKSDAPLANHAARSAEARVVLSKHSPSIGEGAARAPAAGVSPEKQRRIVRKAFRKLEKMNKKKAQAAHAERMETLVHVVVSRDHTIRQQVDRLAELDAEIDGREAQVHRDRIRSHGANYVQDTYSVDAGTDADPAANFEKYVRQCEEVAELQEELREQEALIDAITAQVQDELNRRWMQRRDADAAAGERPAAAAAAAASASAHERERELLLEEERLKTQLDVSLYIGLRLSADLEAIRADLGLSREIYEAKEEEMRDLLEKVTTVDAEGGTGRGQAREWVEQVGGVAKAQSAGADADDDSDTGLSSLHSQDSDSQLVWESLV